MSKLMRNPDGTFGSTITLDSANKMIEEHRILDSVFDKQIVDSRIENSVKPDDTFDDFKNRAELFRSHNHNAFIFSKELIDRFWDDEGEKAQHLMIVLGAHTKDENKPGFEKGQPTIIVTGVNEIESGENKGKFATLRENEPACEYPPCKLISYLSPDGDGTPPSTGPESIDSDPGGMSGPGKFLIFEVEG